MDLQSLKQKYAPTAPPVGPHWIRCTDGLKDLNQEKFKVFRKGWSAHFDNNYSALPAETVASLPRAAQEVAPEDDFGAPETFEWEGKRYSRSSVEFAYMAHTVNEFLPQPWRVVEIGGGYGGFMKALWRLSGGEGCRFDMYDLGPMCVTQAVYLNETLGQDFSEWIHPWQEIEQLDTKVDAVVATRSLFELPLETVDWYWNQFRRLVKPGGVVYSIGRNKISNPEEWNTHGFDILWAQPWKYRTNRLVEKVYQRKVN